MPLTRTRDATGRGSAQFRLVQTAWEVCSARSDPRDFTASLRATSLRSCGDTMLRQRERAATFRCDLEFRFVSSNRTTCQVDQVPHIEAFADLRSLARAAVAVRMFANGDPVFASRSDRGGCGTRSYTVREKRSTLTRLRPAGFGYCRYSTLQTRPRSSQVTAIGCQISGSAAKRFTAITSGTTIRPGASVGLQPWLRPTSAEKTTIARANGDAKNKRRETLTQDHRHRPETDSQSSIDANPP
jgi:hypothetical protein